MGEPACIEVRDLVHGYGRRLVHDHLSFTVHEGAILGLLGKNGVGKTTLIKILMGFLAPQAGRCRVLGEASHALSPAARRRIGLVFEGHLAYDFMTIQETERFFRGWYPRWRRDVFHDLIGRLGLAPDHRIRQMSEGQRSQVVLAVVMAQDPDRLILDDYPAFLTSAGFIGVPSVGTFFCEKALPGRRRAPRCRQSVARRRWPLHPTRAGPWSPISTAGQSPVEV